MICLFSVLVNDTFLFSQLSKRGKRERPFLLYLITKVTYILLSLLYYTYSNLASVLVSAPPAHSALPVC